MCGVFMFCICAMLFTVNPNECDVQKGAPGPPGPPGLQGELGQKGKNITGIISEQILFRLFFYVCGVDTSINSTAGLHIYIQHLCIPHF